MSGRAGRNPYHYDIRIAFVVVPLLLAIETWRRWGNLLSPAALDDAIIGAFLLFTATRLQRRDPNAPSLWIFGCGGASFMMVLSTYGSFFALREQDPSGMPILVVLAFKIGLLVLVSIASVRAIRFVRDRPFSPHPPGQVG